MRLVIVTLLVSYLILVGCAGREAHPVMVQQYGDREKSCDVIEHELGFIEQEISTLAPKTDKTSKNVALGAAGAFLLVPFFFMDLSQAEQIEINAYRRRYNHLLMIAHEKECGIKKDQIPDFNKSN